VQLLFSSTYFWWPKMTGRFLDEKLGKLGWFCMWSGTLLAFGTMHVSGWLGMPRRIGIYRQEYEILNHITTVGWALTFIAALIVLYSLIRSYFKPRTAKDDAWGVNDLQQSFEWATSSPPPPYNFAQVPPIPVLDPRGHH
jgi:cytochrome c oxidase subunit I